jgi:hypothetical protein
MSECRRAQPSNAAGRPVKPLLHTAPASAQTSARPRVSAASQHVTLRAQLQSSLAAASTSTDANMAAAAVAAVGAVVVAAASSSGSGGLAYPKIKRWGSLSRAGGFLQARGRCAWTRLTPIEMRMETTTVLAVAHFNRHEERLRWRLCSPPKTSRSWSSLEERSMTEVRVGS